MRFERGIVAETLLNLRANWAVAAIAIGTTIALILFDTLTQHNSGTASSIAWVFLAISAHTTVLKGQSGPSTMYKKGVFGPFLWRGFAFAVVAIVLLIPAAVFAPLANGNEALVGGIGIILYFAVQALLLSMWGTWFPAVIADGNRSLAAANKRGRKIFGFVFVRLIGLSFALWLGAAVFAFLLTFLAMIVKHYASIELGFDVADIPTWIAILAAVATQTVLLATILSRAYLIAEAEIIGASAKADAPLF